MHDDAYVVHDLDPGEVLSPLDYPGHRLRRSVLLRHDHLADWNIGYGVALELAPVAVRGRARAPLERVLDDEGVTPLHARALVVGVGANAAPPLVLRKLRAAGTGTVVPFVTCTVTGIAVTHSAHVSAGGYMALTPADRPGRQVPLVAAFLDAEQLSALDATEPNYQRLLVDGARYRVRLDGGGRPAAYHLYRSRHGVLRLDGELLPPMRQRDLHDRLFHDAELAALVPGATPEERVTALRTPAVQERLRVLFRVRGWASESGLHGEPAGAVER